MKRCVRFTVVVAMFFAVLVATANPLAAQTCGGDSALAGDSAEAAGYCAGGTPGGTPASARSSNPDGRWNYFCPTEDIGGWQPGYTVTLSFDWAIGTHPDDFDFIVSQGWDPSGEYARYTVLCYDDLGNIVAQWDPYYIATLNPTPPEDLRDAALARIVFPDPELDGMGALFHAAQLESWFWVDNDWEVISEAETQGLVTVEVFATPFQVLWNPGDGGDLVCFDQGVEWSRAANDGGTTCGYTFVSSTADEPGLVYHAESTIEWDLTWTINGVDQGSFGTGDATSPFEVPVGEVQIVEVS